VVDDKTVQFTLPKGENPIIIGELLGKNIALDAYEVIDRNDRGQTTYQIDVGAVEKSPKTPPPVRSEKAWADDEQDKKVVAAIAANSDRRGR